MYLKELESFKNGCGKSTLIFFCENTIVTELPKEVIEYPRIFKDDTENILNGVKIHHDYLGVKPSIEMKEVFNKL